MARFRYYGPNGIVRECAPGEKLDAYLKSHKVSRMELCRRTGMALQTVSDLCKGKRDGVMSTWVAIARALHCKLDDIVEV